jgi:hypothetical protein
MISVFEQYSYGMARIGSAQPYSYPRSLDPDVGDEKW